MSLVQWPPVKKKYVICGVLVVFLLDYFGIFAHFFEKDFAHSFHYPYDGDISSFVLQMQKGIRPDVDPINSYNFSYLHINSEKCKDSENLRLVLLVKSSLENFERRQIIRRTWGFEKRFSDVKIIRIFILGNTKNDKIKISLNNESDKYGDIVQVDFIDNYYNNTLKTLSAFRWVTEFCPHARFYFFSDDDMYVSIKNVLRFLRNPTKYPDYIQLPPSMLSNYNSYNNKNELMKSINANIKMSYNYDISNDVILYAGFVFISSPQRHRSSKWYVSLKEYPYNLWPPYVTGGAYILSKQALSKLYYASFYTKNFRFDDVYLGIVALKAGVELFHCDQFYFYKKKYNLFNYKYVIASHGYENGAELERIWNEQKEAGNA